MKPWRRSLAQAFLVAAWASIYLPACGGGCYAKDENFQVTPSENCIQPVFDVCQAQGGWLTLKNNCSEALVLGPVASKAGADSSVSDAGTGAVTIAAGEEVQFNVAPFADTSNGSLWQVSIPATLGSMSVAITFEIAR